MDYKYRWIAQDKDGAIWFFNTKPEPERAFNAFYAASASNNKRAEIGNPNPNWKDSLIDLEKEDYEIVDGILERRRKNNPNVLTDTDLLDAIEKYSLIVDRNVEGENAITVWNEDDFESTSATSKKGNIRKAIKKWLKKNVDKKETKE